LYAFDTARETPRIGLNQGPRVPLSFRTAAVGSTNPAKVEAVRRILGQLAPGCAVDAIDVPSGVGTMPLGEAAVRAGALARARAALERTGAEVAFGLEGGAILDAEDAWLTGHVVAVTRDGRLGEAAWGRMLLPHVAAERLRGGEELGDIIDDLFARKESKRQAGASSPMARCHERMRSPISSRWPARRSCTPSSTARLPEIQSVT
jgi:inosine/xanthosine triphosphatase